MNKIVEQLRRDYWYDFRDVVPLTNEPREIQCPWLTDAEIAAVWEQSKDLYASNTLCISGAVRTMRKLALQRMPAEPKQRKDNVKPWYGTVPPGLKRRKLPSPTPPTPSSLAELHEEIESQEAADIASGERWNTAFIDGTEL